MNNREIKFRAWSGKEMLNEFYPLDGDGINETFQAIDYQVMQYTGLRDKNGKEIYERDIIEYKDMSQVGIGQIQWTQCYFEILFKNGNVNFITTDRIINGGIEVIGNIWENGDLLKK